MLEEVTFGEIFMKVARTIGFAITVSGAAWWMLAAGANGQAIRPVAQPSTQATQTSTSAPQTSAASKPTTTRASTQQASSYPTAELAKACELAANAMLARLDKTFLAVVRPPFVVVGNRPKDDLVQMTDEWVVRPAKIMQATYFTTPPSKVVTVLLFQDEATYRQWAVKLYGDKDVSHFGYYKPDKRVLLVKTSTGTLLHELSHALIVYDFPNAPLWFDEGLASLGERAKLLPEGIIALPNWRLPALQDAIRNKSLRTLKELMTTSDFYGINQGANYAQAKAQARYFLSYMQEKEVLESFYRQYRKSRGKNPVELVEKLLGKKIGDIDTGWRAWVMTLEYDGPPPK